MSLSAVGLKTHIWNNNAKSIMLLAGFPLLILFMVWLFFYLLNLAELQAGVSHTQIFGDAWSQSIAIAHWIFLACGLWLGIAWMSHTAMIRLTGGGHPVTRRDYPEIYNMLENLCISRGLKMPQFDIIDTPQLNAFASGISDKNYRITLTTGLIDTLEPDELEAVIAHELTHIINRDVRLLIISIIFVGMIATMAELIGRSFFRISLLSGGRRRNGRSGALMVLIALLVLAVGYIFAIFIRFALSRKREYLADAGAVELTKNPDAMMRALLRISGKSTIDSMPDEMRQMCIDNETRFLGLFATHPSISKRVLAISEMTRTPVPQITPKRRQTAGDTPTTGTSPRKQRRKPHAGPWGHGQH